jgi:proteasome beta subunit
MASLTIRHHEVERPQAKDGEHVGGVDDEGGHVYVADMSGAITGEDFAASGSGSPIAYGVLESIYHKEITNEQAKEIATKAVAAAMERDPGSGNGIDILIIPKLLIVKSREEARG